MHSDLLLKSRMENIYFGSWIGSRQMPVDLDEFHIVFFLLCRRHLIFKSTLIWCLGECMQFSLKVRRKSEKSQMWFLENYLLKPFIMSTFWGMMLIRQYVYCGLCIMNIQKHMKTLQGTVYDHTDNHFDPMESKHSTNLEIGEDNMYWNLANLSRTCWNREIFITG